MSRQPSLLVGGASVSTSDLCEKPTGIAKLSCSGLPHVMPTHDPNSTPKKPIRPSGGSTHPDGNFTCRRWVIGGIPQEGVRAFPT